MVHESVVLCMNVGAKGNKQQRNQAVAELVETSGAELVLLQEYYYKGTEDLVGSLPGGTGRWRVAQHATDTTATKADTIILYDNAVFDAGSQIHGRLDVDKAELPSLLGRYTAVRISFVAGSTDPKPNFLLLSYHGRNNKARADNDMEPTSDKQEEAWDKERWSFAKELVSMVGEAACKNSMPALIGGDWNTNSHAPRRKWKVDSSNRWEGRVVDVAHFNGSARRYQDSSARIDFFYAIQPAANIQSTTRQTKPWRLSLGNVTAIVHSKELRGLFDHDPIVASLRLDPPGALPGPLTPHKLAFAPLAEIDTAALPDGELQERCRQLGSEVEVLSARVGAVAAERDKAQAQAAALQKKLEQAAIDREVGRRAVRETVETAETLEAEVLLRRQQLASHPLPNSASFSLASMDGMSILVETASTPPPRSARQRQEVWSESPGPLPTPANAEAPQARSESPEPLPAPSNSDPAPSPRLPSPEPVGGAGAGVAGAASVGACAGGRPVLARRFWLEKMRPRDLQEEARLLEISENLLEDREGALEGALDALCQLPYSQLRWATLRNLCRDHALGFFEGDTKDTMSARLEAAQEAAAERLPTPSTSKAALSPRLPTPEPSRGAAAAAEAADGTAGAVDGPPALARRSWLEKMRPADLQKEAGPLGFKLPEDREGALDALSQERYGELQHKTLRNLCRDHALGFFEGDTKDTMSARLEAAQDAAAAQGRAG